MQLHNQYSLVRQVARVPLHVGRDANLGTFWSTSDQRLRPQPSAALWLSSWLLGRAIAECVIRPCLQACFAQLRADASQVSNLRLESHHGLVLELSQLSQVARVFALGAPREQLAGHLRVRSKAYVRCKAHSLL